MKKIRLVCLFMIFVLQLKAQSEHYYIVEFNNNQSIDSSKFKPATWLSPRAIERRKKFNIPFSISDQPLSNDALKPLLDSGFQITGTSKWLKAVAVHTSKNGQLELLKRMRGVEKVTYIGKIDLNKKRTDIPDINEQLRALETRINPEIGRDVSKGSYGLSLAQNEMINLLPLHAQGLEGNGICVAVLDAGFKKLYENLYFTSLYGKRHILFTRDLVDPSSDVFDDAEHGTSVLSCMAAWKPAGIKGTARNAAYILLRTEDEDSETLLEEFYWVMGAELADSAGADLIQSSLGYNNFDDAKMNHKHKDLDGKTTFISRGAFMAVQKGILVVNSSGNEGDGDWRKIVSPADVKEVITVGGVDHTGFPSAFSSTGPTADRRIKPDVSALAEKVFVVSANGVLYPGNGTSYAAPLISGGIACLMQACPQRTPAEIADALRLSSNSYNDPDKFIGYGIPDMLLALRILGGDTLMPLRTDQLLDARYLSDKRIHFTVNVTQPQKFDLIIGNATDQILYQDKIKIKQPGIYRFSIRASKRFASGIKKMSITFTGGPRYFQIEP